MHSFPDESKEETKSTVTSTNNQIFDIIWDVDNEPSKDEKSTGMLIKIHVNFLNIFECIHCKNV